MTDPVNPSHYRQGEVECIDAIASALSPAEFRGYLRGQIIKYTWRLGLKGSAEVDTEKALWYARLLAGEDPRK